MLGGVDQAAVIAKPRGLCGKNLPRRGTGLKGDPL
jgi:hypothetical protein